MDWKTCLQKRLVKQIQVDKPLTNSLLNASYKKALSEQILKLDDTTAASKISLAYDALRELLEALSISRGYKIYNHESYTAFLQEVLHESILAEEFDSCRKLRNSVNYYGKEITVEEAKPTLKAIRQLRDKILKQYFREDFSN